MQLESVEKRLFGMDDSSSRSNNGEPQTDSSEEKENGGGQTDDSVEKGTMPVAGAEDESKYPPFKTVILSMLSIYMAFFLSALDRTIIGVAIPAISNEFKSFDDISWYEAAFLFTFCVAQFPIGKIYTFYSPKWTFAVLVAIFEIGSIVCAAAPSSLALIIGRAITGIGGAGSLVGASVLMIDLVPLHKRPNYQGFLGAMFGLASIIGPLIGGLLTSKASWRYCFWINVPIGGLALVGLLVFLPASPPPAPIKGTFWQNLWKFDPIGNAVLAPGIICLLLGLQWGGTKYPWKDSRVLALLVVGPVLLLAFFCIQAIQENGTIPLRILRQRSMASGVVVSLGVGPALIIPTFYFPIWFQAIKGISAVQSGIRLLPLLLGTVVFVIGTGIAISKSGQYAPWLIIGCAIRVLGGGLMTTLRVDSGIGQWFGYQLVAGIGTGMTLQQCSIAAQTVLAKKDVTIGLTIIAFVQFLASTISLSVSQTILANTLTTQLSKNLPGFDALVIANAGATQLEGLVSKEDLPAVLRAYNMGIDNAFYVALAASCLAFVASFFMEWKSVKGGR